MEEKSIVFLIVQEALKCHKSLISFYQYLNVHVMEWWKKVLSLIFQKVLKCHKRLISFYQYLNLFKNFFAFFNDSYNNSNMLLKFHLNIIHHSYKVFTGLFLRKKFHTVKTMQVFTYFKFYQVNLQILQCLWVYIFYLGGGHIVFHTIYKTCLCLFWQFSGLCSLPLFCVILFL